MVEKLARLLAVEVERMARHLARWHVKLKNLHAFDMLAHWHVKMRSWYAFGTLACGHVDTEITLAGMARMEFDVANPFY